MISNVKIEQDKERPWMQRVYKDGQEITRVRHIDANFETDEIPTVNFEIIGGFDFEGMADIQFDYLPYTVREACKILSEEISKNKDLRDGFISSIISALNEMPNEECYAEELAEQILNRIIGEEKEKG